LHKIVILLGSLAYSCTI